MEINNFMIFGDSYSTFEGYIPNGYACYYYNEPQRQTDVTKAQQTWWHKLAESTNSNLVLNNSWSGSTICYTGYNNTDCSKTNSFIYRLRNLKKEGFFDNNQIDTVFVFGATNDNWCGANLGKLKFSDWEENDFYNVLPAICFFFKLLKECLPNANIVCIINTELKYELTTAFFEICEHYNAKQVLLKEIDKLNGHPTVKGMSQICEQVLENL